MASGTDDAEVPVRGVGDCSILLRTMMDGFAHCRMVYDDAGRPADWVYLEVNPAFEHLTGVSDVEGKTALEVFPSIKDDNPELFEMYGRVAAGGGPEAFEVNFHPLNMWMRVSASSPSPGHFVAVFANITERKDMEAALSLAKLSLDRSADMIHWLTRDGRIIYASESSMQRIGRPREELVGSTIFDLDPDMTPEAWERHWADLRETGSLSLRTVHVTSAGEVFPVEVTANYLEIGGHEYDFAFTRDISDRERLESSLRLTQLSVDRSADLIHWIDAKGHLLFASDSTCRRLGYSREELLGMTVFDVDPVMTQTTWADHWQELRREGTLSFESVHRTKQGDIFPVEIVANFVIQGDKEYNFAYARDISHRKHDEQELHKAKAELEARNRQLEETGRRLMRANKELIEIRDALAFQARTDALTGSLNRGAVLARLEDEIARGDRAHTTLAVGVVDIDHFKRINDTYGHPAGDRVLCEIVARSIAALRPYDVFGRFGGEEFLVVVPDVNDDQAREVLERVRNAISATAMVVGADEIILTASIGGVVRTRETAEALVQLADKALYAAKEAGRDRVVMADRGEIAAVDED